MALEHMQENCCKGQIFAKNIGVTFDLYKGIRERKLLGTVKHNYCFSTGTFYDTEVLLEFAKLGCYCEYDLFGIETSHYQLWQEVDMPSDAQRIAFIRSLLDNGYGHKVLMAHDIHTKHRLVSNTPTLKHKIMDNTK